MGAHPAAPSRAVALAAGALALCAVLPVAGCCRSLDEPTTVSAGDTPVATGAVQATMTAAAEPTVAPTSTAASAATSPWPDQVGAFAANVDFPVWYPATLPAGMKLEAVDIVELEPGSGLVCDIVFYDGERSITFIQGSPKTREYDLFSKGTVPWGDVDAEVVHQDVEDPSTPRMIVLRKDGTLAELSGEVDYGMLAAVAASMARVK